MTTAQFDAPASSALRTVSASSYPRTVDALACRTIRVVWLTARLVRNESVSFERYRQRFGVSLRTFRRDINFLRDAGAYLDCVRDNGYRLTCFFADADAV